MNFDTYSPLALRTAKRYSTRREDLRHAALGLITEIGEFASEVKRIAIYDKIMTAEMRGHMLEELGDVNWYVSLGLTALGMHKLPSLANSGSTLADLVDVAFYLNIFAANVSACCDSDAEIQRETYALAQCLAAIVYLIDDAAATLGTTGDEIRANNIAKLKLRYPDAYSNEAAEARADKGGVAHTES